MVAWHVRAQLNWGVGKNTTWKQRNMETMNMVIRDNKHNDGDNGHDGDHEHKDGNYKQSMHIMKRQ